MGSLKCITIWVSIKLFSEKQKFEKTMFNIFIFHLALHFSQKKKKKKICAYFELLKLFLKVVLKGKIQKFDLQTDLAKYVDCFVMYFLVCAFWQNRHEFTKQFGFIISPIFYFIQKH